MRKIISRLVSGLRLRLLLLVLLACAPLVGLTLHTASEERRRLVKEWNQRSHDPVEAHCTGREIRSASCVTRASAVARGDDGRTAGRGRVR